MTLIGFDKLNYKKGLINSYFLFNILLFTEDASNDRIPLKPHLVGE